MSDNEVSESKLPGKNVQIVLTVVFLVIAIAVAILVMPKVTVQQQSTAPGGATAGGPRQQHP